MPTAKEMALEEIRRRRKQKALEDIRKRKASQPTTDLEKKPLGPTVEELNRVYMGPEKPSVVKKQNLEHLSVSGGEPTFFGEKHRRKPHVTPAIPVEAPAMPDPGSAALVDYIVKRPSGRDVSPVARVDKIKRAREVYDAFEGDKTKMEEKLRSYAKARKKSSGWVKNQLAEIVNLAEAQPEGTTVDEGALEIVRKTERAPVSDPSKAKEALEQTEISRTKFDPKDVLEGGIQTAVAFGGKDLDVTPDREKTGKTAQVVGDVANLTAGILTTGGLGKTLVKQAKSPLLKKIGGILANPDTNPVPDAIYAGLNEGDFSEEFVKGYAVNLALGRIIGGKDALKVINKIPETDRALIRENMEALVERAAKGDLPDGITIDIKPEVQEALGIGKQVELEFKPINTAPTRGAISDVPTEAATETGTFLKVPAPQRAKDWVRDFTPRNEIREISRDMQAKVRGGVTDMQIKAANLEKQLKGADVDRKLVNDLLQDPELRNSYRVGPRDGVTPGIMDAIDDIRTTIDDLSVKLKDDGRILSDELNTVVDENMGVYLRRSYRKFYERDWWKKVSKDQDVVDEAKDWVREAYGDDIMMRLEKDHGIDNVTEELFDSALQAEIKAIASETDLDANAMQNFKKWLGSVDRNNLKQRKSIPAPIRRLMGEIDDPVANSIITANNMITQVEQSRENRQIIEQFMGGENPVIYRQKIEGYDTPITIDTGFGTKETLYTSPDIAKEFKDYNANKGKMEKWLFRMNGYLKAAQTVYNPKSHVRNFVGNSVIAAANGHFHVQEMAKALDMVMRKGKHSAEVRELIDAGLLSSDVITSDIADMLNKGFKNYGPFGDKDVNKVSIKQLEKLTSSLPQGTMQKLYQGEDDVWKVYGYLNELKRGYSKEEAIKNAKLVYPNYANLPRWNEKLRNNPVGAFIGTFTAFPTAMMMSGARTIELAAKEAAKGKFGRAFGVGLVGGSYAGREKFTEMVNQFMGDGESFSEEFGGMSVGETTDLMRNYLSDWERYAEIIPTRIVETPSGAKGIEYVNMSYTNPYSVFSEPAQALAEGKPGQAAMQVLQPYSDPSMLASMMMTMVSGVDSNGKVVWSDDAEAWKNIINVFESAAGSASPWMTGPDIEKILADIERGEGEFDSFADFGKAYLKGLGYEAKRIGKASRGVTDEYGKQYTFKDEAINFATGTRRQVFVPEQALKRNLWDVKHRFNRSMIEANKKLRNEPDDAIIEMFLKDGEKNRKAAWLQIRETAEDFRKFGMTNQEIGNAFLEIGLSKKMIKSIATGRYVPYQMTAAKAKRILKSRDKRNIDAYDFLFFTENK